MTNIILLILDAWRYDCFNQKVTPFLYSLKNKSQIYENHFSCSSTTSPSVTTIMSGKLPNQHGIYNHKNMTKEEIERGEKFKLSNLKL